ncbi:hypothetical protein [Amycolatopsis sp. NPDC049868]|uniref:hypothetical protein n=1 Tax=Amycolatopsis sp. NPDC049868 TaxID=3363934 RepID=UPI0037AE1FAE
MTNPRSGFSFDAPHPATRQAADNPATDTPFDATSPRDQADDNSTTATGPLDNGEPVAEDHGGADDPATANQQDPLDTVDAAPHHTDTAPTAHPGPVNVDLLDTIDDAPQNLDPSSTTDGGADLETKVAPDRTGTPATSETGPAGSPTQEENISPPHQGPADTDNDPPSLDTLEAAEDSSVDLAAPADQDHHTITAPPATSLDAIPEPATDHTESVTLEHTASAIHGDNAPGDNNGEKAPTHVDAANDAPPAPETATTVGDSDTARDEELLPPEQDTDARTDSVQDTAEEQTRTAATTTESSHQDPETITDSTTAPGATAAASSEAVTDAATEHRSDDRSATAETDSAGTESVHGSEPYGNGAVQIPPVFGTLGNGVEVKYKPSFNAYALALGNDRLLGVARDSLKYNYKQYKDEQALEGETKSYWEKSRGHRVARVIGRNVDKNMTPLSNYASRAMEDGINHAPHSVVSMAQPGQWGYVSNALKLIPADQISQTIMSLSFLAAVAYKKFKDATLKRKG